MFQSMYYFVECLIFWQISLSFPCLSHKNHWSWWNLPKISLSGSISMLSEFEGVLNETAMSYHTTDETWCTFPAETWSRIARRRIWYDKIRKNVIVRESLSCIHPTITTTDDNFEGPSACISSGIKCLIPFQDWLVNKRVLQSNLPEYCLWVGDLRPRWDGVLRRPSWFKCLTYIPMVWALRRLVAKSLLPSC